MSEGGLGGGGGAATCPRGATWAPLGGPKAGLTLPCPCRCHVSLGGEAATIQTYTWDKKRLVATAYPLTP